MAEKDSPRGTLPELELGFVESPEDPAALTSLFFPSKVGGKPAWLDQTNLPSPSQLSCNNCSKPTVFLLQVYAPIEDGRHRTLFLFMCRDPQCHQKNTRCFKMLRCQLAEGKEESCDLATPTGTDNNTNSDDVDKLCCPLEGVQLQGDCIQTSDTCTSKEIADTAVHTKAQSGSDKTTLVCIVCGCNGPKFCGKCKRVNYCSREHQLHDWKNGHKLICSKLAEEKYTLLDLTYDPAQGVVLPELEIVTEVEPDPARKQERSEEERMMDYLKLVEKAGSPRTGVGSEEFDVKKLEEAALSEHKTDKQFRVFKKRVAIEPEQVIRYQRGGQPLLVANDGAPNSGDVPRCSCGAERQFEFQVMPQLLYYLKLDSMAAHSIDWGTLIVYTCVDSCTTRGTGGYHGEFLWKQHFSN